MQDLHEKPIGNQTAMKTKHVNRYMDQNFQLGLVLEYKAISQLANGLLAHCSRSLLHSYSTSITHIIYLYTRQIIVLYKI